MGDVGGEQDAVLSGRAGPHPSLTPFALADGTVIAIDDTGPRDATDAVLLVPGWTQDHTSWEDVTAELHRARPDLRVVVPEARGHGWSDAGPRGTYTIDQLADDVAEVIERYVPDARVALAGHSLGGPIVMALAQRHPDLVAERVSGVAFVATSAAGLGRDLFGLSSLVTVPAMLVAPVVTKARAFSHAKVNLHVQRTSDLLALFIRRGFYGPGAATAHNRKRTAAQVGRAHPAASAVLVDEMLRHDRVDTLADLRVPCVVLVGTKDGLTPIAHSRELAEALPEGELVVYPNAGHMLPYERPAEVAQQIAALLDEREGQSTSAL